MKEEINRKESLAQEIRMLLAGKNISIKQFAEMIGFSTRMVNKMLNGSHDFSFREIAIIEKALKAKLLIVPDKERVITITMNIDTSQCLATTTMQITENGEEKKEWTAAELMATANVLIMKARGLAESAIFQAHQDEIGYREVLVKLKEYETPHKSKED